MLILRIDTLGSTAGRARRPNSRRQGPTVRRYRRRVGGKKKPPTAAATCGRRPCIPCGADRAPRRRCARDRGAAKTAAARRGAPPAVAAAPAQRRRSVAPAAPAAAAPRYAVAPVAPSPRPPPPQGLHSCNGPRTAYGACRREPCGPRTSLIAPASSHSRPMTAGGRCGCHQSSSVAHWYAGVATEDLSRAPQNTTHSLHCQGVVRSPKDPKQPQTDRRLPPWVATPAGARARPHPHGRRSQPPTHATVAGAAWWTPPCKRQEHVRSGGQKPLGRHRRVCQHLRVHDRVAGALVERTEQANERLRKKSPRGSQPDQSGDDPTSANSRASTDSTPAYLARVKVVPRRLDGHAGDEHRPLASSARPQGAGKSADAHDVEDAGRGHDRGGRRRRRRWRPSQTCRRPPRRPPTQTTPPPRASAGPSGRRAPPSRA